MSQLQNTAQVFQNNDLVTAAKLNALVNQTTLTSEAVTAQAAASSLTGDDVVLGHEAATGTLVKVSINDIRANGDGPIKSNDIQAQTEGDLNITNSYNVRSINILSNGTSGGALISTPNGAITLSTGTGTKSQFTRVHVDNGPVVVDESIDAMGYSTVANMSAILGSPIVSFTVTGNHGLISGTIIELDGPTAEFDGVYPITTTGLSTFNITLPANATVAHTSTAVTYRLPTLRVREFTYLNRLQVVGATKFDGVLNCVNNPPQFKGADIKPRYDYFVQTRTEAILTSGWGGAQNTANLYGTKIPQLDLTFTPKKAGNTVVLQWNIFGESTYSADTVLLVTRTPNSGAGAGVPVALPNAVDASNNTWSGVTTFDYQTDDGSTPNTTIVKIVDLNSLDVACTYSVHFRAAANRTSTFHLNRSVTNSGTFDRETGLSLGHAHEIYV
jgi:hypothetical protein